MYLAVITPNWTMWKRFYPYLSISFRFITAYSERCTIALMVDVSQSSAYTQLFVPLIGIVAIPRS